MSRTAARITCNEADRQILEMRAGSRTEARQIVEPARMILGCVAGEPVTVIARRCHTRPNTVIKWRQRFAQQGLGWRMRRVRAPSRSTAKGFAMGSVIAHPSARLFTPAFPCTSAVQTASIRPRRNLPDINIRSAQIRIR